jgi:uncharacterized phage protein (TIGR01671 family)
MREYKFRGKRINSDEWIYGYGVVIGEHYGRMHGEEREASIFVEYDEASKLNFQLVEVDPKTVGQYTGLQDRNGVDIYEGDISEGEHAIYLILWDEQKAQFRAKVIKTKSVLIKHCSFPLWQYVEDDGKCRFGLIGNRFDNPELLGEVRE